jgi:energy-coupling factor transporter ATP-binding protein EcfA2
VEISVEAIMLQAKHISFRYPQANQGLKPTSLEANPGEITLVTGSSGSGKSTLARCLMGLIPHLYNGEFAGKVWLNGFSTDDVEMWQIAEKAGMVFQNSAAQMLAPSVEQEIIFGLENLGLDHAEIKTRLERVLDQFGLAHLRWRSPQTLSGGEQQKLALAAMIARQTDVLILDEPLSMLDTTAAGELIAHLEQLAKAGKTIVIFEHRKEFLEGIKCLSVKQLDGEPDSTNLMAGNGKLPKTDPFAVKIRHLEVDLGGRLILNDLNLDFPSRESVAVIGRNGVGKTTLLRALAGLQKYAGRINAVTPSEESSPDLGIVFQNPDLQLFNPSVKDEILYRVADPDMELYETLLDVLGLKPYEDTPPLLLSEGEKKRLAFAMILMRKPKHGILLDEPSLGQDSHHKAILFQMIDLLVEAGKLVVLTTHDLTLAAAADRLILLGADGVVADGRPSVVFQDVQKWQQAGIEIPDWFRSQYIRTDKA